MENVEGASNGDRTANANANEKGTPRSFGARLDRMSGNAQQAYSSTRDSITDIRARLDFSGRMSRNPVGMLAAAVGAGYVLGGGLFSPLTARILGMGLRMGLRAAAIPFIKDELLGLVEAASGTDADGNDDGDGNEGSAGATGGARRKSSRQRSSGSGNTNQGRQP